jgi:hypothetical protein
MVYFQTKKSKFGYILEGLAMEDVGVFYGHSVYFTAIRFTLWPFGTFSGNLVYFPSFWYIVPRKSGNPVRFVCTKSWKQKRKKK